MNLQYNKNKLVKLGEEVTSDWLDYQMTWIITKIERNMHQYGDQFPSACTTNGKYRIKLNDDWTNGFWTGMLWLAYENSSNEKFRIQAIRNLESFQKRLDNHYILDHHDIGFLYSLSAGPAIELLNDETSRNMFLQAADVLLQRFQPKGEFIQAWGKIGDSKEYRLIIDSLLNLPLLFKATEISGNQKYREVALRHYHTLLSTVIRPNGSTYHTYYFDEKTGLPLFGKTAQGNSDNSTWARGQSWAILGIPLDESYAHSNPFPARYDEIVNVFLESLPKDLIPYWDFDFTDENPSEKDSSSAAVVACGLLEAEKCNAYPDAGQLAKGLIYQLGTYYTTEHEPENEGLLLHGVYAHSEGKGINEPNLWGDYFYFEALMRLKNSNWKRYW